MNGPQTADSIPSDAACDAAAGDSPVVERREDGGASCPVSSESRNLLPMASLPTLPALDLRDFPQRLRSDDLLESAPLPHYHAMVRDLKSRYKISIRKWRSQMSGVAYELTYRDGRIKRLISAPRPRSPVSAAIFLHEVGHHAIGFRRYSPRCLEEYYVWQWAFREMAARNIPLDSRVQRHYRRSMYHYLRIARRSGHHVPHELVHLGHWPG